MQDKFESLSVDDDDVVPYRHRASANRSPYYRNVLILVTLMGMGGYGAWHYTDLPQRLRTTPAASAKPVVAKAPERTLADAASQAQPQTQNRTKPLADCMGADNLINSEVVECRFGQVPQPTYDRQAQGMVSAQYLAQYKADQHRPVQRQVKDSTVQWTHIRQWDGKAWHLARWTLTDNRIEGTSVCSNLAKGSIDYRECRKGAKVHFREQCKRWSKDPSAAATAPRQRYCSAAQVFNPLG